MTYLCVCAKREIPPFRPVHWGGVRANPPARLQVPHDWHICLKVLCDGHVFLDVYERYDFMGQP